MQPSPKAMVPALGKETCAWHGTSRGQNNEIRVTQPTSTSAPSAPRIRVPLMVTSAVRAHRSSTGAAVGSFFHARIVMRRDLPTSQVPATVPSPSCQSPSKALASTAQRDLRKAHPTTGLPNSVRTGLPACLLQLLLKPDKGQQPKPRNNPQILPSCPYLYACICTRRRGGAATQNQKVARA